MARRPDVRHVVVTGGSRGIGLATARAFAGRGAKVSLLARDSDRLAESADGLRAEGTTVTTAAVDVAEPEAVAAAIDDVTGRQGPCDVLVTSAGATRPGRFVELDDEVFRHLMDVNYYGTLHAVRAVVPSMVARGRGSIVGVSSAAGLFGVYGYTAYAASKFAVRGLLESLRQELAPHGVHVACVYPADVDTDMLRDEEAYKPVETRALAGTIAPIPPDHVARAIVHAVEHRRSHVTTDRSTGLVNGLFTLARRPANAYLDRIVRRAGR